MRTRDIGTMPGKTLTQRVYLSLGSNLADRVANLKTGIESIRGEMTVEAVSSIYETHPVGMTEQPKFLNLAAAVQTTTPPHELLSIVKRIEQEVGRTPTARWGPRVLDIDILMYGETVLQDHTLVIPHRELANRAFVLVPLAEIAPEVTHPLLRLTIGELRDRVGATGGIKRLTETS